MPQGTQIASLFATVGADLTGLTGGLAQARGQLAGFQNHMSQVGGNLMRVGGVLTAAVTTPIVGLGAAMVNTAGEFQSATNILGIAARQSGTPLAALHDAALLVGSDAQLIGIDAMQAAEAMTTFYKTGFTTSEIMGDLNRYLSEGTNLTGALRASIDLAAASDLDLARSSDAVAIALKTFNLGAEDATAVADSFVGAADASVAEVSDLADAMYTVGPTANQFGWTLQDTNTALAILSERGIRGSEAGTALRSMMTNMMRDTDKTTAALDTLNISLYDQSGQMRTLPDIMGQLSSALSGLSEEERNYYIQTLAGTYGMKAMATFVAEGAEGWRKMAAAIEAAATAQEVGEQRTQGYQGKVEALQGAWQTFLITAGELLLPDLTTFVGDLTTFVDLLSQLPPGTIEGALKGLGILAAAGPVALGLGSIIKLLALVPPQLLAVAGAAALVGGIGWFGSEKGKEFAGGLANYDDAMLQMGGPEGLQRWIEIRQGVAKAQGIASGLTGAENPQHMTELPAALVDAAGAAIRWSYQDTPGVYPGLTEEDRAALDAIVDAMYGPGVGRSFAVRNGEIVVKLAHEPTGPTAAWSEELWRGLVSGESEHADVQEALARLDALIPPEGFPYPVRWVGYLPESTPGAQSPEYFGRMEQEVPGAQPPVSVPVFRYGGGQGVHGMQLEDVTYRLVPEQTADELRTDIESVLPGEGSLRRSIVLDVVPNRAQLDRSAAEIASEWAAAVNARLAEIQLRSHRQVDRFDELLMSEASAYGMTP